MNTAGTKMIVGFCLMVKKQNTRVKNLRSQKAKKIKIMFDLLGIPTYYIGVGKNYNNNNNHRGNHDNNQNNKKQQKIIKI